MLRNRSGKSIQHVINLAGRKRYLNCILAEPEEGCQRPDAESACNSFVIKDVPKMILTLLVPFAMQFRDILISLPFCM